LIIPEKSIQAYHYNDYDYYNETNYKLEIVHHSLIITWSAICIASAIDVYLWNQKNKDLKNFPTGGKFNKIPHYEARLLFLKDELDTDDNEINFYILTSLTKN